MRFKNIRLGVLLPLTGARRVITGHPARDLLAYRLRLLGHRLAAPHGSVPKVVPRVVELINQR